MTAGPTSTPGIACDLSEMTDEQRARHRIVSAELLAKRRETTRAGDRWTVTFEEGVPLALLAEFLEFERRCCAFVDYDVSGRGTSVCLELGGPEGSGALIEELFPLVRV